MIIYNRFLYYRKSYKRGEHHCIHISSNEECKFVDFAGDFTQFNNVLDFYNRLVLVW